MIIQVLPQKYLCNCNKGISKESNPDLLIKLNKVIQWDKKEEEDTSQPQQLKPGDTIYWNNNVIAINSEDSVVLIVTESGPGSIKRFVDYVNEEYKFLKLGEEYLSNLEVTELDWSHPTDDLQTNRISYSKLESIKNRCNDPKDVQERNLVITSSPFTLFPSRVMISGQNSYYDPEYVDPSIAPRLIDILYFWITKNKKKD